MKDCMENRNLCSKITKSTNTQKVSHKPVLYVFYMKNYLR